MAKFHGLEALRVSGEVEVSNLQFADDNCYFSCGRSCSVGS